MDTRRYYIRHPSFLPFSLPLFLFSFAPLPTPSTPLFVVSPARTAAARISVEFRLMNYMRIRCKFYRLREYIIRPREIVVMRALYGGGGGGGDGGSGGGGGGGGA